MYEKNKKQSKQFTDGTVNFVVRKMRFILITFFLLCVSFLFYCLQDYLLLDALCKSQIFRFNAFRIALIDFLHS